MLSINDCRKFLGESGKTEIYNDSDIETMRELLYILALIEYQSANYDRSSNLDKSIDRRTTKSGIQPGKSRRHTKKILPKEQLQNP